jgi:hypothetical protein
MRMLNFLLALALLPLFLSFTGCSDEPDYTVEKLEVTSVVRSFPDKDDWLHNVSGKIYVRFNEPPDHTLLESLQNEVGVSLFVYTKGSTDPFYFLDYDSVEVNETRIAKPYTYEKSDQSNVYVAKWELTDIYFGDQEFNDKFYEAVAVASDTVALKKLVETTALKSLLNLPNKLGARLVFSDPFEVQRGSPGTESEEELFEEEPDSLSPEEDLEIEPEEEDSLDQPSDQDE